ncbi:MAG: 50S ribosomal protein L20 [Pirellulaceae bacterium]
MRTVKGAARTKSKRRLFKRAKGYVGGRSSLFRTAKETLVRAGVYAMRDRRAKRRSFRQLWITRLSAACRMHDISYSQFIDGLTKANIELDRKSLSDIAIADPAGFEQIVNLVKGAIAK